MKKRGKAECVALPVGGGKAGLDLPRPLLCLPAGLSEVPVSPSLPIGCAKQALNADRWSKLPEKLNPIWSIVSIFFPQENFSVFQKFFHLSKIPHNSPQF